MRNSTGNRRLLKRPAAKGQHGIGNFKFIVCKGKVMEKPGLVLSKGVLLVAGWLVFMRCLAVLAAAPIAVEQLKMATFSRVPGLAGQGACIATGNAGSWNEQFVGTPTVVFDEGMYWMWYSGVR